MKGKKKKSRMGRPPKKPSERRTAMVTIRLMTEERQKLGQDARKAGMSLSSYLLKCWREKGK